MSNNNKNQQSSTNNAKKGNDDKDTYPKPDLQKLEEEAEKERTKKPGSQSNTTGDSNHARGSK